MKKIAAAALAASLAAVLTVLPSASGARRGGGNVVNNLAELYRDGRYFELRDAVARMDGNPAPALDFYRGAVDMAFNRLESAIAHLLGYLDGASVNSAVPLAKAARLLLVDAYRRAGRYGESAETLRTLLGRYGATLEAAERTALENQLPIWSALAGVPPQTVEVLADSVIRMDDRHLPVAVMGRTLSMAYDTGSSLSILFRSAADELGLALFEPAVRVQSATGRWVEARAAIVPEMRLGEAVLRNAVFLVIPDGFFSPRWFRDEVGRQGLLGAPVLAALKEFTETRDGLFLIPALPRPRPVQNMCFFGFTPIVEVVHRWVPLPFVLDTGSASTFLHPPFFNRYRGEIKGRSKGKKTLIGGIGDARMIRVRALDEFDFKAGGMDLALKRVQVHEQVTTSCSKRFFGTLGLDLLVQCTRMTFNFESMSFILE